MLNKLRFTQTKISLHLPKLFSSSSPPPVGIFWDLDSKPPKSIAPYDAAYRLRLAASSLGPVKFSVAYANPQSSLLTPSSAPSSSSIRHICRVCGRKFYRHASLLNHFAIHQSEQTKRLNRINSARGGRKVQLAAKLSQKIQKYKKVATEIDTPEDGYSFTDELKRAGVKVGTVENKPEMALRDHMVEEIDKAKIGCFVLVSDDSGFVPVVRQARARKLRTVVVGDEKEGTLMRCADAGFSWKDVILGKARKEAGSAVGKWKDRDLLKRLEWTYKPDEEESEWEKSDGDENEECLGLSKKCDSQPWWKLDADK